ncbi:MULTISPECIES: gliding motility lipoprotein GldB [Chitinophagaceae]
MLRIRYCILLVIIVCSFACGKKRQIPDVSKVSAPLEVIRSEQDFFRMDTMHVETALDHLQGKYGKFLNDYLYNIIGLPPFPDSVKKGLPYFLQSYRTIDDSVQAHFKNLDKSLEPLRLALRLTKYYFPQYQQPAKLITFVGPMDGYGSVLTSSGLAVGLQMYLGKDFPTYQSEYLQQIYPTYISRRFEPEYIPVNCMKNIIQDMYPDNYRSLPLVEQMIEAGKRMYLLDQLLPYVADTLKIGYTDEQLKGCYKKEEGLWNYFTVNNLLYVTEPDEVRDYMNDGPRTPALGEGSPANIGTFIGWQIVKKWMNAHTQTNMLRLMDTPASQIFKDAKYKPH